MDEAIQKADVLIEALGWIRQFRDKIVVVKLGGSLLEDEASLRHLLVDIVFLETVGMRPVVVHGGGGAISRAMDQAGLSPRFLQGRRYTDDRTLAVVEEVLVGEINPMIAARIEQYGGRAMPLSFRTNNVLFGQPITVAGENGQPVSMGHVGEVTRVDRQTLDNLTYAGQVPVIPSMCLALAAAGQPEKLNVNADTAAMAVAAALGAEKLVFLSDVNGVRTDPRDPATLVHTLDAEQARTMIGAKQIQHGMIPKVEACLETLRKGVRKIHIVDGRLRHSLLLEIYTNLGVGTEIVESPESRVQS